MRREGRVGGKPTNKTRATGKCKRVGCHGCHSHPINKADVKCKGREKRFAGDVNTNPRLAGVSVSKPRKSLAPKWDDTADDEDLPTWDDEEVIMDAAALTFIPREDAGTLISLANMIEGALLLKSNSPEMGEGGSRSTNDDDDEVDLDIEAFKCEFETFKNGIEAASCQTSNSHRIRVAPSDSSWSEIELSETEGDWEDEDDWSMVEPNAIIQFGHAYT